MNTQAQHANTQIPNRVDTADVEGWVGGGGGQLCLSSQHSQSPPRFTINAQYSTWRKSTWQHARREATRKGSALKQSVAYRVSMNTVIYNSGLPLSTIAGSSVFITVHAMSVCCTCSDLPG